MPRLKPDTRTARREHILDAAERCFARSGFHRTTMHDICRAAEVSPGALYVYFASKEDLIAGIAERDRDKLARQMLDLAAAPDLMAALHRLGEHYMVQEPQHKRALFVEIGAEATRNDNVGETVRACDRACTDNFAELFERARAEGRIAPSLDSVTLATVLGVIGDGLFWRRAIDPHFDTRAVMPVLSDMLAALINPRAPTPTPEADTPDDTGARAPAARHNEDETP